MFSLISIYFKKGYAWNLAKILTADYLKSSPFRGHKNKLSSVTFSFHFSFSISLSLSLNRSLYLDIITTNHFLFIPPPPRPRPSPKNSLIHKKLNNKIVMKICYISSLCIWTYCNNVSVSIFWCRIARFSGLLSYICSNMCKVEWENES